MRLSRDGDAWICDFCNRQGWSGYMLRISLADIVVDPDFLIEKGMKLLDRTY